MPAPVKPELVSPFWTGDDLAAINAFNTNYTTSLANLGFELGNLETDTAFQKKQTNEGAKKSAAGAQDDAAARGIFYSSIKDAGIYDIEAQRSLQTKFLNDKLTSARLNSGTQKGILTRSKADFDTAYKQKQKENAQGKNDANSSSWADAMAAWEASPSNPANQPAPAAPAAPKPSKPPKPKPNHPKPNQNQGTGNINKPKKARKLGTVVSTRVVGMRKGA